MNKTSIINNSQNIGNKVKKNILLNSSTLTNGTSISAFLFIVIFLIYVAAADNVFSVFSINNLFNNMVALAIASIGLTLVILKGGFDLSVGSVIVLSNVIIASSSSNEVGEVLSKVVIVFIVAIIVGVINGFFVAYVGVQPIAVTLATMIMGQGIALVILPAPGGNVPPLIYSGLTTSVFRFFPIAALIILISAILWLIIKKTPFGVHVYAIGADERAAEQAGISTKKVKFFVYVVASIFYGIAGIMYSAQTGGGDPTASTLFLLLVFAAVAIGGTQFGGGSGGAIGSIIGAGILTVLQKTLFAVGVSTFYTSIFQGLILIVAVVIGNLSNRQGKWGKV